MKKKIICMLLVIVMVLICFVGCEKTETEPEVVESPLKVVDIVEDPWGRELQKIYYNEINHEYILKEFIYQKIDGEVVCVDQKTTIIGADEKLNSNTSSSVTIYYNKDLTNRPAVIMDNEYARVTVKKFLAKDSWWEFGYDIEVLNKTDKVITVSFDNVHIMDISCKPMFSIDHIETGKTANFMLGWDRDTLERCYIPYVDNIEFMVRIFDNEDWDTAALAGSRVLFKN